MNKLDYKDISLVSNHISTITTRDEIDTSVEFLPGITLSVPIIASPMKDVCDGTIAKKMAELGGFGFIHRFCSIKDQIEEARKADFHCGCAVGLNDYERVEALHMAGCSNFLLDVA